jgi:hypothetical protein
MMDINSISASLLDPSMTNNRSNTTGSVTPSSKLKTSKTHSVSSRFSAKSNINSETNTNSEIYNQDQKNVVFITGQSLQFILKDETLQKLFLSLCSLCSLIIGSSVTAYQKRDLT